MRKLLSIGILSFLTCLVIPNEVQAQIVISPLPFINTLGVAAGPIKIPQGSAAAPSIIISTDILSGIYQRTAGTLNIGIGGNNTLEVAAGVVTIGNSATLGLTGKISTYNNITTVAYGVPVIVATGRQNAQTAAVTTLATYTPTADGSFEVTGNITMTAFAAGAVRLQLNYTSEDNIARALNIPFWNANVWTITAGSVDVYVGGNIQIRAKASTAITLSTAGTFTTVTYNTEGFIKQIN